MLFDEDVVYTMYEGMEQLANALRRNQGLQKLLISWGLITDAGRRFVLEILRDNTTLLKLSTIEECPNQYYLGPSRNYVETMKIQSPIDRHMKLNRFWDRLQRFPYRDVDADSDNDSDDDSDSDSDSNDDEEEDYGGDGGVEQQYEVARRQRRRRRKERKPISLKIYPDILEVLAKKPLLLYKFLRGGEEFIVVDHTQLFGCTKMLQQRRRRKGQRRSDRIIKKRRIVAPGNAF